MRRVSIFVALIFVLSLLPAGIVQNSTANLGQNSISISSGSYQAVSLGLIDLDDELEIDYSVDDNIDVLLMNSTQYYNWQNGGVVHIESGSDYDDNGDDYVYKIEKSDSYYVIFDNSNQAGYASSSGATVTGSATISVSSPNGDLIKTRTWSDSDSHSKIAIPATDSGDILSIDVECDIGLTSGDDLDFFLMDSIQENTLATNSWDWNLHASFEDTCSHSWEYETGKDSGWYLIVDNSDQGRTDALGNGIMVDVEIDVRNLIPLVEIADTSRMIDSGDYFRIDTGYVPANGVIDIDYSFWSHGTAILTDDLDILVMESSEANQYENSNDATVLGHTTMLDAGSQSWSYQFPNAGTYSIIFDNTDEPQGGAGDGSDIQVEIGVTSLTIPSLFGNIWTGWHQSIHYADEGDHMALDLGNLSTGDDIYYYVDGKNEGGSIWSSKEFDILFMNKENYDLYVNGSSFSTITDGTKYKEDGLIPAVKNMTVSTNSHYMLVLDAADGPDSYSADENGDWIWEFIVLSDGGAISNLHAEDNHYEDSISVGTISAPDSDGDGVRNGLDECQSTPSGINVDSKGCDSSQLDDDGDGITNDADQCPDTPHGDSVDSNGCTIEPDSDNDGVSDSLDSCPNTPLGESVDSNGCSQSQLDDDNDGVMNNVDQCPNTNAGENVNQNGCANSQLDDDNDGVNNNLDQCPNTPFGESVDANGCSQSQLDDDNDGVMNNADQCPNTSTGENVNQNGCANSQLDDDNDGVNNNVDQCQNTPSGESIDNNGCSNSQLDDDNDGVMNSADQCPNTTAGEDVDEYGCSPSQRDVDYDSITDDIDQCPNTPLMQSASVNTTLYLDNGNTILNPFVGCAPSEIDADGDSVTSDIDWNDNDPEQWVDSDNDGYGDNSEGENGDQCPNTPFGEAVDSNGCSQSQLDDDNDGVKNNVDQCPNTATGESVNADGCPDSQIVVDDEEDSESSETSSESEDKEDSGGLPGFSLLLTVSSFTLAVLFIRFRD